MTYFIVDIPDAIGAGFNKSDLRHLIRERLKGDFPADGTVLVYVVADIPDRWDGIWKALRRPDTGPFTWKSLIKRMNDDAHRARLARARYRLGRKP